MIRTTAFPPAATGDSTLRRGPHFSVETRQHAAADFEDSRYTADEVAALSEERIMAMTRRELIEVIRSVRGGHLLPGARERLPQMDGETLRRLVFLTRRFCRNQQRLAEDAAAGVAVGCS
jgi:hypothetical protein